METTALEHIRSGHLLMAVCCFLYLVWWVIFFWPKVSGGSAEGPLHTLGIAAIIGAVIAAAFGTTRICGGAVSLFRDAAPATVVTIASAALLYIVLLVITWKMFERQPTTELLLFVAWLAMELFVAVALSQAGMPGLPVVIAVGAMAGFVGSLVCYMLYYQLKPLPSFIDGCVPLALVGTISIAAALL